MSTVWASRVCHSADKHLSGMVVPQHIRYACAGGWLKEELIQWEAGVVAKQLAKQHDAKCDGSRRRAWPLELSCYLMSGESFATQARLPTGHWSCTMYLPASSICRVFLHLRCRMKTLVLPLENTCEILVDFEMLRASK